MSTWSYTKGLHDLGNSVYAYLQPDGSWGWSNAGIITDGHTSLLIDTLADLKLTQEMLDTMRRSIPAAAHIGTVVNTHADGDHCFGNQLVADVLIIASGRTVQEMMTQPSPEAMAELVKNAPVGRVGEFIRRTFGLFDLDRITLTLPQQTFEGRLTINVGEKAIELIEVGPAHTRGDTLVYIPGDRTMFTGDILFMDSHPVIWAGPVSNWIRACNFILGLDVETIVPGHGPITDKRGVIELKGYLEYMYEATRRCYEAGMPAFDAAKKIALDRYAGWLNRERIVANVAAIYRELSHSPDPTPMDSLFEHMAQMAL